MAGAKAHSDLSRSMLDFWLARGAVLVIIVLQLVIVNELTVGPRWLAPSIEMALLLPLSLGTAWTQRTARRASSDGDWLQVGRRRIWVRRLAVLLTAITTFMNFGALAQLIQAILGGHAGTGRSLLLDALNIWATNVVAFALWFWTIDRGGPASKGLGGAVRADFVFTQQQMAVEDAAFAKWRPGFVDYLFLAFTNATAFSPADCFPLTQRAKLLMMTEAAISFATIALVASRAVGILN